MGLDKTTRVRGRMKPENTYQAAGTPLKMRVPRTPFGPSDVRKAGTFSRGIGTVCQKSEPESLGQCAHAGKASQVLTSGECSLLLQGQLRQNALNIDVGHGE